MLTLLSVMVARASPGDLYPEPEAEAKGSSSAETETKVDSLRAVENEAGSQVRDGHGNDVEVGSQGTVEREAQRQVSNEAQSADSLDKRSSSNIGAGVSSKSSARRTPVEPPYRIVLRSLVYPGWGQLCNRKHMKALTVFTSEITLLGMIYTESREASEAFDEHLITDDVAAAERLYAEYESHFERRNSLIWWTAGLILFSLADAYVDAHLLTFQEEFGEPDERAISLTTGGYPNGGFVALKCVF